MRGPDIETDVVVVGSGIGGTLAAHAAASKGRYVTVLERGQMLTPELVERAFAAQSLYECRELPTQSVTLDDGREQRERPIPITFGGLANFYAAVSLRMREAELQHWPLDYDEIEPYYHLLAIRFVQGCRRCLHCNQVPCPVGVKFTPARLLTESTALGIDGMAERFDSYAEALRSAYDIAVIGVPPRLHAELIEEGLARGKHLLIEKPVVASFAELKRLYNRMSMASQVVMVAENMHFDPFHRRIKALLSGGMLGVPILLELQRLGRNRRACGWRLDPAEMPLGALHESGVHWIRRLLDLASVFESDGRDGVETVHAFVPSRPLGDIPGEDTTIVFARHSSGLISRLFHSWGLPRRALLLEPSRCVLSAGTVWFDGLGRFGVVRGGMRRFLWPSLYGYDGYAPMWRHFLGCVVGGLRPELDAGTIFRDFAYLDAAYRSIASGRPERPEPLPGPTYLPPSMRRYA